MKQTKPSILELRSLSPVLGRLSGRDEGAMADQAVYLYNRSLEFLTGAGVPKDEEKAFRLNADSASLGYGDAVLAMGWFYLNGTGVQRDLALASKWYKKSARKGDPRAMFSLGQMAYDARDFAGALLWFNRAIEKGHARSVFWLGKLYWHGRGVVQDKKRASDLFRKAERKKVREAQRALTWLARRRGAAQQGDEADEAEHIGASQLIPGVRRLSAISTRQTRAAR